MVRPVDAPRPLETSNDQAMTAEDTRPKYLAHARRRPVGSGGISDVIADTIRTAQKEEKKADLETPSVIQAYMNSALPNSDKAHQAQLELAMLLVSAGFETSGSTLATAHYHLLANVDKKEKLRASIEHIKPSTQISWTEPEKIPYLRAVILESLRLSLAAFERLSIINKARDMYYKEHKLPRGTIISMSHWNINCNEHLFEEPRNLQPERWLQGEGSKELESKFWPFSKGQRACIGTHLAWAEIYIALATIFRRFDMEPYSTTREDVDPKYDRFVPAPITTNGVRAMDKSQTV